MEKIKELMNTSAGNFKVETLLSALLTLEIGRASCRERV